MLEETSLNVKPIYKLVDDIASRSEMISSNYFTPYLIKIFKRPQYVEEGCIKLTSYNFSISADIKMNTKYLRNSFIVDGDMLQRYFTQEFKDSYFLNHQHYRLADPSLNDFVKISKTRSFIVRGLNESIDCPDNHSILNLESFKNSVNKNKWTEFFI